MIINYDDQTIIAQCTPKGSGALALLRLSGLHALSIAESFSMLASGKKFSNCAGNTIHYGHVINELGEKIDQVLFLLMKAPHTFTGQDTIEITCHNNQFIIEHIIEQALRYGARLAQEGEFTKRSLLNNKIDLIQAEAINEIIQANTRGKLKQSLSQLQGSLSHVISTIEHDLLKALALCEASFEFLDEEMNFDNQIRTLIAKATDTIVTIKKTYNQQQQIRQGVRIAILGSVNAGKSSLFNALLTQERAIVSDIAGTTRDVIEAGLYKDGLYWTLVDTAGLRNTHDIIEQEGIKRSYIEGKKADIILLVFDGSRSFTADEQRVYHTLFQEYQHKTILVRTKADLALNNPTWHAQAFAISDKADTIVQNLEYLIATKIEELFSHAQSPFLLNKRQFNLLLTLEHTLNLLNPMLSNAIQHEIISYHLNDALSQLSELTGKSISEKGMDTIFKEFCIGK